MAGSPADTAAGDDDTLEREHLLGSVCQWLTDSATPVLVLEGEPGAGKSALATQAVTRLRTEGAVLGAVVLRGRNQRGPSSAAHVAEQLTQAVQAQFPEAEQNAFASLTHAVPGQISATVLVEGGSHVQGPVAGVLINAPTPLQQIEQFVFPVLEEAKSRNPDTATVVCVLDALNEYDGPGSLRELIGQVLECQPEGLPLRWVVTTTPNHGLGDNPRATVTNLADFAYDVDTFLEDRFNALQIVDDRRLKAAQSLCRGNFLVAHYLIAELHRDQGLDPATFTAGCEDGVDSLGRWYRSYLARLVDGLERDTKDLYLWLLSLLATAATEGGSIAWLKLAGIDETQARTVLDATAAYLSEGDGRFSTYHRSFADYLLSTERDALQRSRAKEAHLTAARLAIDVDAVWENLTVGELRRLPWQLTRAAMLCTDDLDRATTGETTRALATKLFEARNFVDVAEARIGWAALADPHTVELARWLTRPDADQPEPTAALRLALARVLAAAGELQAASDELQVCSEDEDPGDATEDARRYRQYLDDLAGIATDGDEVCDILQRRETYARRLANGSEEDRQLAVSFLARDAAFNPSSAVCRAQILQQLDKTKTAIEVLEPFTQTNPYAAIEHARMSPDTAEQTLGAWLDEHGVARHEQVCLTLVSLLEKAEQNDKALEVLQKNAEQFANVAEQAARRLHHKGETDAAIYVLQRWADRPSAPSGVVVTLANLYNSQGDFDAARSCLTAHATRSANAALALVRHLTSDPDVGGLRRNEPNKLRGALEVLEDWWGSNEQAAVRAGQLIEALDGDDDRRYGVLAALERWMETVPAACRQLAILIAAQEPARAACLLEAAARGGDGGAALKLAYAALQNDDRAAAVAWLRRGGRDSRAQLRLQLLTLSEEPEQARKALQGWMRDDPAGLARILRFPIDAAYDPEPALDLIAYLSTSAKVPPPHPPPQIPRRPQPREVFAEVFDWRTERFSSPADEVRRNWCRGTLGIEECGQLLARVLWHTSPRTREPLAAAAQPNAWIPQDIDRQLLTAVCAALRRQELDPGERPRLRSAFKGQLSELAG